MICFGYRGYGRSTGTPSEGGLQEDARAITKFIKTMKDEIDVERVYLIGRSLGGAVAVHNVCHDNKDLFKAVIIENSFTSIPEMAVKLFPFLKAIPASIIMRMNWDSLSSVRKWPA